MTQDYGSGRYREQLRDMKTGALRSLIADRTIFFFLLGSFFANVSVLATTVALPFLAWQLTSTPAAIGVVGGGGMVFAALAPFGGAIADRLGRFRAVRLAQTLSVIQALTLIILALSGNLTILGLIGLVCVSAIIFSIGRPAQLGLLGFIADKKQLAPAVAAFELFTMAAKLVAPLASAVVIDYTDSVFGFIIAVTGYVFFLLCLSRIKVKPTSTPEVIENRFGRNWIIDFGRGVRYVIRNRALVVLLVILTVLTLSLLRVGWEPMGDKSGLEEMLIVGITIGGYTAAEIGHLALLIWLLGRTSVAGLTKFMVLNTLAAGLFLILSALFWNAWFSFATGLFISGICIPLVQVLSQVLLINATPRPMLGRMVGIFIMFKAMAPAVFALLLGVLTDSVDVRIIMVVLGVMALFVWLWLRPRLPDLAASLETPPVGREA